MNSTVEIQRVRVNRNIWKTSLTKEILNLEDNLDQIFYTSGLKPHRVVNRDPDDETTLATTDRGLSHSELKDYERILDEQVEEVKQAVNNICALISSVTEFDLPIPIQVLLRLANRVGSIRCPDFTKKVPGSMAKRYVSMRKSLDLIKSSLLMYKWISTILGTNILPFRPHINQSLISFLEWTRTSNLHKHSELEYFTIRSSLIENISEALEQLSLNLNLDSEQLMALVELELIESLEELLVKPSSMGTAVIANVATPTTMTSINGTSKRGIRRQRRDSDEGDRQGDSDSADDQLESLKEKYTSDVIICLDRLFIVYADYLGAKLEFRLKNFIIQSSIKIYRDFENTNVIGLANRRQLLRLLETISNRPCATSTSELAWHIFELAERLESDPEIRYLCRRAVKLGLAHRPIVVSHFDVYDCQVSALHQRDLSAPTAAVATAETQQPANTDERQQQPPQQQQASKAPVSTAEGPTTTSEGNQPLPPSPPPVVGKPQADCEGIAAKELPTSPSAIATEDQACMMDEQVQSYLDLFVDKPATTLPAQPLPNEP